MDPEYNILGGYIPSFVQHLEDTGERLGLRIGSQVDDEQTSVVDATEDVAEEHVHADWTPAEYNAFFRALSVHSRWRPDLIAACVPTRTKWDVWMYLEALEEGAATLTMQQGGSTEDDCEDVEMQVDGPSYSRSHSDADVDEEADLHEPALEVSQAWIDAEECMASWIVQEEHLASVEAEADAVADTGDEPPKRKRGRPREATKRRARSRVGEQTVSNEGQPLTPPDHRSPSQETPTRGREVLMGCLEAPHLLVLDGILREDEVAMREKSRSQEDAVAMATPTEHGDEARVRDADVSEETNDVSRPSGMAIDPVLLTLSGGADPAGRPSEDTCAAIPTRDPSPLPHASTSLDVSGMGYMVPLGATPTDPDPAPNGESELSLFSPRSRRRIQKRLYMRRKRASLGENSVTAEGVYTGVERLKPGRKAKLAQKETPDVSTSQAVRPSEEPSDVECPENVSKKNKPGLTLPYKLRARFAELDIDAAYLRAQGMNLLNMGTLGKLMGLYASLEADASVIAIDAEVIRQLQAVLVMFVTEIIHRAIVWKEREIRLKQRSQAWRHGDQITTSAVDHAVEAIGARYHSHKAYFKALGVGHGPDPPEEPATPGTYSPHRDVYTPLVHPPSGWEMDGDLVSDDTDEDALEAALLADDEVDASDRVLAVGHEEALWTAIRID